MVSAFSNLNLLCDATKLIYFYLVSDNCILSHVVITRIAGRVVEVNVQDFNEALESKWTCQIRCIFTRTPFHFEQRKFWQFYFEVIAFHIVCTEISHTSDFIQSHSTMGKHVKFCFELGKKNVNYIADALKALVLSIGRRDRTLFEQYFIFGSLKSLCLFRVVKTLIFFNTYRRPSDIFMGSSQKKFLYCFLNKIFAAAGALHVICVAPKTWRKNVVFLRSWIKFDFIFCTFGWGRSSINGFGIVPITNRIRSAINSRLEIRNIFHFVRFAPR